jgi:hypothetical protein
MTRSCPGNSEGTITIMLRDTSSRVSMKQNMYVGILLAKVTFLYHSW